MTDLKGTFRRRFGYTPPGVVDLPVPIELLGAATVVSDSPVISLALNPPISIAMAPTTDGKVDLIDATGQPLPQFFATSIPSPSSAGSALDIVTAVLMELRESGIHFGGFNAAVNRASCAPNEAAALAAVTTLAMRQLFPYALAGGRPARPPVRDSAGVVTPPTLAGKQELARLCGKALQRCHLTSQAPAALASLMAKESYATEIDSPSLAVEYLPCGDIAVLLAAPDGGTPVSELVPLKTICASATAALGLPSLCRLDLGRLRESKSQLTPNQYQCACHVVAETQRVIFAGRALRENDEEQFVQYVQQSHEDYAALVALSPEMRLLGDLARKEPACLAIRKLPGQETMLLLTRHAAAAHLARTVGEKFRERTGREAGITRGVSLTR